MILMVTGSRALADTPGAEAWAERVLLAEPGPIDTVVTGDAGGADAIAQGLGFEWGAAVDVWHIDGRRVVFDGQPGGRRLRWKPDGRFAPLARNAAMVAHVAATYAPQDVRVLGLLAPWSRTHGTHHTLRLARAAGLHVEERVCPAELGPPREGG